MERVTRVFLPRYVFPIEPDVFYIFPRYNSYNCVEQIARRAIITWRNNEISQSRDRGQVTIAARVPSRVTAIVESLLINARIESTPKSSFMRILRIACNNTRSMIRVTPWAKSKFVEDPRLMPYLAYFAFVSVFVYVTTSLVV